MIMAFTLLSDVGHQNPQSEHGEIQLLTLLPAGQFFWRLPGDPYCFRTCVFTATQIICFALEVLRQTKPMETHPVATGSIVTNRAMKKGQRIDGEAWVSYGAPISGLFLGPPL